MRGGKQKRARASVQEIDQIAAAADVATQYADRLRKRSHLNVHSTVKPKMVDRATAGAPEDTGRVSVVDHHDRAVSLRDFDQGGQRRDVAIHREHAVGNEQLSPWDAG